MSQIFKMLEIVFRDEHLVAVNKPANMLVHRSKVDRHETQFVMQTLRDQIGQHVFPLHRLDKPTSGVLLFATSASVASLMQGQFAEHKIEKQYIAIVRGYVDEKQQINYSLAEQLDKMTDNLDKKIEKKEAVTHLRPIASIQLPIPVSRYPTARFSLLELKPITGRKHQLRRHMAHIRHPIIGDTTHGDGKQNRFAREKLGFPRLALHAHSLCFFHPFTKQNVTVKCSFDSDFSTLVRRFDSVLTRQIENTIEGYKRHIYNEALYRDLSFGKL
ncbi:tRNA pseudouridine(65) synthase TruC [Agaribacter flavus]|uniref:tRNA pseudouridine synthase C n=1 Tax=Agaribacter flavus TaxID=1902781 RepID=A0ABV7FT67_9ALTE